MPGWRRACFFGGLCLIVVAFTTLGSLADDLFWAHMVEHLAIGDLGTLLLVLGLTGPVLAPVLRIGFFDRLRVLAHPLVAFPLWAVNLYLWHVPYFHEGAVRHAGVHALQHFGFVACGFNMWLARWGPRPSRPGSATSPAWPVHHRRAPSRRRSSATSSSSAATSSSRSTRRASARTASLPGADQNTAGAIMMIEGSILTLGALRMAVRAGPRARAEERQELLELAAPRAGSSRPRRAPPGGRRGARGGAA